MKLLVTASTVSEIEPLLDLLGVHNFTTQPSEGVKYLSHDIDILISGAGIMRTSFSLGRRFAGHDYDLALNPGIAGSFSGDIRIGDVVNVVSEQIADFGSESEDGEGFLDVFDLGLEKMDTFPFSGRKIINDTDCADISSIAALPRANGITVNTCHGRRESIVEILNRLNPDVESMEGAAFMFACSVSGIPFFEIRAISNHVEPRNREKWNIPRAVARLNDCVKNILKELAGEMV